MREISWRTSLAAPYKYSSHWFSWLEAHPRRGLMLIVVLMLLLSGVRLWFDPPSYQSGQTDNWWSVAINLIAGRGYTSCFPRYFPFCGPNNNITGMREPLPVYLFTAVAFLSGYSFWAAAGVELALNLGVML